LQILYTTSNEQFELGYSIIKKLYPQYIFIRETLSLKENILEILNTIEEDYVTFLVDDIVLIRDLEYKPYFKNFETDLEIENIIIRTGKSFKRNFNTDSDTIPQPFINDNYLYNWKEAPSVFWGHPITTCGFILRKNDISEYITKIDPFRNVNEMEDFLVCNAVKRQLVMCLDEHIVVELCFNTVQDTHSNPCGILSAEYFNKLFLQGKRLYIDETKLVGDFLRVKDMEIEWK
jgi:hypothetical protein